MNARNLTILGVLALVLLGTALWSSQSRRAAQDAVGSQPLVPGLEQGINDITEVRVRLPGDRLEATLRRTGSGWVVVERDGWPADADRLREYLLKLARARRVEAKTDNPASYYKIGVEDIGDAQTAATQFEIDGLAQPVKLLVGHNVQRGSGTYVRFAGEAQSWQADADLAVEKSAANWLQRDLVDVAAGRIAQVEVTPASGGAVKIERGESGGAGDFVIANLPKGREASSDFVADATAGFLASLRFDDVLKAGDAAAPDSGLTRARFTTREGVHVEVTAWQQDDKTRAQFRATLDEERAQAHAGEEQARAVREYEALKAQAGAEAGEGKESGDGEAAADEGATPAAAPEAPLAVTDPEQDRAARLQALREQVEAMNARFDGRTFVLPSYKTSNLHKPLEDYLKPKA